MADQKLNPFYESLVRNAAITLQTFSRYLVEAEKAGVPSPPFVGAALGEMTHQNGRDYQIQISLVGTKGEWIDEKYILVQKNEPEDDLENDEFILIEVVPSGSEDSGIIDKRPTEID